jgi:lysozyme
MTEQRVSGIDVSHFQGTIDWNAVAKADIAFAFIKATDGEHGNDPLFGANWSKAREAGLKRGAYHFFRAQQDPERQAQRFLAMLGTDPGELPPVLDFEVLGEASPEQGLSGAQRWAEIVEKRSGRTPMLYTGPAFWNTTLKASAILSDHALWIAHYTSANQPKLPSPWRDWTFWQYSEKGRIPGIHGPVDLDCFNGTLTELDDLCERIEQKSAAIGS